jgi:RNA polymerase sigma-70 factor (ECF subfamily)
VVSLQENETGSSGATSASLLERLKARDPHAWERFVDLYGPLVFHWGHRHGLHDEDAADVMQEVLSAVAGSVDRFQHATQRGRFRGWLWTITRNKIRDHHRRLKHQVTGQELNELDGSWESLPEEWSDDASEETRHEVSLLVHRALELIRGEFQPHTWEAFWRSVVGGEDTDQIAKELGLSRNGVRQAKSRVLRRLRAELGDLEP